MTENTEFRSGFVSVIGRPNVGKSTLLNQVLGQKIAAVSPRPQTTQRNQLGIVTTDSFQLIFIDTPGIHLPKSKLGQFMNDSAISTFQDVDYVLWIVSLAEKPTPEDEEIARKLARARVTANVVIALNKADLVKPEDRTVQAALYQQLVPEAQTFVISAQTRLGCEQLLRALVAKLPEGPSFYDEEQITDLYEREIARDFIRESLLKNLDEEIPHAIGVRIDDFIDRSENNSYIKATLLLDREAHKSIVIGKGGTMIRKIGEDARREIEKLTDRKIFLELNVKVEKNWRNNPEILKTLGFVRQKN